MHHAVDLQRDQHAPAAARRALDGLPWVADEEPRENARLLVSELVSNAVMHGEGQDLRLIFDVRRDGSLRCEVVDDGHSFEPVERGPGDGWGLHLVERLATRWGVHEGSTHVWFELPARV